MNLQTKILFIYLFTTSVFCQSIYAQWYLDTATPEEAATHDRPFTYLRNEIQKKLCDANWGTDKTDFKFFKDDPSWQKIVRGKAINYFDFTGGGDNSTIEVRDNSALAQEFYKKELEQNKFIQQAYSNGDKAKIDQWNRDAAHLSNEQVFAGIGMMLNDDRILGKKLQDFPTQKVVQLHNIPGIAQAILYYQYPVEDDPDTTYKALLYIGNFPKYSGEDIVVNFKYKTNYYWKDKQHSGPPVIENMSIWIESHHYNNIMKVIHSIDWTGLKAMIKE